jgi:hypothetical protein
VFFTVVISLDTDFQGNETPALTQHVMGLLKSEKSVYEIQPSELRPGEVKYVWITNGRKG